MSKHTELCRELEAIQESTLYKDFADMMSKISNLGVATAVLGGFLHEWCQANDEDFLRAVALMVYAYKEVSK